MATKKSDSSSNKSVWLIGGIAALIAVAAIIAVAARSGGDEVVEGVEEFHPVKVVGEQLPEFSGGATDPAIGMMAPVLTGQGFTGNKNRHITRRTNVACFSRPLVPSLSARSSASCQMEQRRFGT